MSPSSRRAWIEIPSGQHYLLLHPDVALLAEGVDRNDLLPDLGDLALDVALLAEGVDRNVCDAVSALPPQKSPSSRRAWIEILLVSALTPASSVALHPEGVDNRREE